MQSRKAWFTVDILKEDNRLEKKHSFRFYIYSEKRKIPIDNTGGLKTTLYLLAG